MSFIAELKQLDTREPGRWPLSVRTAVILTWFAVLSVVLVWFGVFVGLEKKDDLDSARATEVNLRKEFETKHGKAVNLDLYMAQLEDIKKSFGATLDQLPNKAQVSSLLTDISDAGLSAGLQQQLFQPQAEQNKDFYAELPIKIRLTGSYHQMGQFVSSIAALPRIVTLHDVNIQPASKDGGYDRLQIDVTAKTYRALDEAELAASEAQRKAAAPRRAGAP
jgi:type IV pilus assembly protein PilO